MSDLSQFAKDVQARIRLSDVIGQHVELRRRGTSVMGLCPFHHEKTPSFHVHDDQGFYHCFGCGAGGDAIKFLRELEGLDFIEALKRLADLAGMQMPEARRLTPAEKKRRVKEEDERETLLRLHREARDFFRKAFRKNQDARDYAKSRGLKKETLERFEIGYAPDGWQNLLHHLKKSGATEELLERGGLATRSAKEGSAGRVYDRFRHRLIFPICDAGGKPVAFGARAIRKEDDPKYLNSPETPIYHKSQTLYALHLSRAAIRRERTAILLEGYMDVIAMWQAGFENVVASCGTSLTREQGRVLSRLADRVYFLYDGDEAGQKAMKRGLLELLPERLDVRVVALPTEHDPDSFLRDEGVEAMRARLASAGDAVEHFLGQAIRRHGVESVGGRVAVAEEMFEIVAAVSHPIARSNYAARLAEVTQTPLRTVESELRRRVRRERPPETEADDVVPPLPAEPETPPEEACDSVERALLRLALENVDLRPRIRESVPEEWFASERLRRLMGLVLDSADEARLLLSRFEADEEGDPGAEPVGSFIRATLVWRDADFARTPAPSMLAHLARTLRKSFLRRRQRALFAALRGPEGVEAQAQAELHESSSHYVEASGAYYGGPRSRRARRTGAPQRDAG